MNISVVDDEFSTPMVIIVAMENTVEILSFANSVMWNQFLVFTLERRNLITISGCICAQIVKEKNYQISFVRLTNFSERTFSIFRKY